MTQNAISTAGEVDELYWPTGPSNSGKDRTLHVTRQCRYLTDYGATITSAHVSRLPRGSLCKHCSPDHITLDDIKRANNDDDQSIATDGGTITTEDADLPEETHVSEKGLWIPPALRHHTGQIIFRTPRGTIQHWRKRPLEPYYGIIDASSFGPEESFRDCRNPELAPLQVSIKPAGEDAVVLDVTIDTDSGGGS